jgi:hypothetical protein
MVFPAKHETAYDERGRVHRPDPTLTFTLTLQNTGNGPAFKFRFTPSVLVDGKPANSDSFAISPIPSVVAPRQRIVVSLIISGGLAESIVNGMIRLEISTDAAYCSVADKCQSHEAKYRYSPESKKIELVS